MLVLLVIAFFAIGLLSPLIGRSREAGRRASCMNKLRQIGLGLQSYESKNGAFPPSASVAGNGPGKPATVGGWSFLVRILPFMGCEEMYQYLPPHYNPEEISNRAVAPAIDPITGAMNTSMVEFVCPSNGNQLYRNPNANPPTGAFTNYKGMGASTNSTARVRLNRTTATAFGQIEPRAIAIGEDRSVTIYAFLVNNGCEARA